MNNQNNFSLVEEKTKISNGVVRQKSFTKVLIKITLIIISAITIKLKVQLV